MKSYACMTGLLPQTKGSLATLAEELGREKINIEGLCAVEEKANVIFHLLTTDKVATSRAITKVGYKVTRHLADAGINLTTVYLATDTRLVLSCENLSALETAWKDLAAVASR